MISVAFSLVATGCGGTVPTPARVEAPQVRAGTVAFLSEVPGDAFAIVGADFEAARRHPESAAFLAWSGTRLSRSSREMLESTRRAALVYAPRPAEAEPDAEPPALPPPMAADLTTKETERARHAAVAAFRAIGAAFDIEPAFVRWSRAILVEGASCDVLGEQPWKSAESGALPAGAFRHLEAGRCVWGDPDLVARFARRTEIAAASRRFAEAEIASDLDTVVLASLARDATADPLAFDADEIDESNEYAARRWRTVARTELASAQAIGTELRGVTSVTTRGAFRDDDRFVLATELRFVDAAAAEAYTTNLRREIDRWRRQIDAERVFDEAHPAPASRAPSPAIDLPGRRYSLRNLVESFDAPTIVVRDSVSTIEAFEGTALATPRVESLLAAVESAEAEPAEDPDASPEELSRRSFEEQRRIEEWLESSELRTPAERIAFIEANEAAIDDFAGESYGLVIRIEALLDGGDFDAAIAALDQARERIDPSWGDSFSTASRSRVAWERGDFAALTAIATAASERDRSNAGVALDVARGHALGGAFDRAIEWMDRVDSDAREEVRWIELEAMRGRLDVADALLLAAFRGTQDVPIYLTGLPAGRCHLARWRMILAHRRGTTRSISSPLAGCDEDDEDDADVPGAVDETVVCEILSFARSAEPATRTRCEAALDQALRLGHPHHDSVVRILVALSRLPNVGADYGRRARAAIDHFPSGSPIRRHFEWMLAGYPTIRARPTSH